MSRFTVVVPAREVDLASGLLWNAGVAGGVEGVEERPAGDGAVKLVVSVASDEDVQAVRGALAGRWEVDPDVVDPDAGDPDGQPGNWVEAWRPFARPTVLDGLVVRAPWSAPPAGTGGVEVIIDPGPVFGHGAHPSTRGVLMELLGRDLTGTRVLDVGCGSGVLGVAAAVLGAAHVDAVDIDPVAVEVTRANSSLNGVSGRVSATTTPVGELRGGYDLVVANLDGPTIRSLAGDLAGLSEDLMVGGFLDDQAASIAGVFDGRVVRGGSVEGWSWLALSC